MPTSSFTTALTPRRKWNATAVTGTRHGNTASSSVRRLVRGGLRCFTTIRHAPTMNWTRPRNWPRTGLPAHLPRGMARRSNFQSHCIKSAELFSLAGAAPDQCPDRKPCAGFSLSGDCEQPFEEKPGRFIMYEMVGEQADRFATVECMLQLRDDSLNQ